MTLHTVRGIATLSISLCLESLGEFGKHVPQASKPAPPPHPPPSNPTSQYSPKASAKATPSPAARPHPLVPDTSDMDEVFSSEFIAEAEAQLGEAMQMLSNESPELWQQFETFAKSMGLDEAGAGAVPPASGAASKGESSVDIKSGGLGGKGAGETPQGNEAGGGGGGGGGASLEEKLEETIRKLQSNASRLGVSPPLLIKCCED